MTEPTSIPWDRIVHFYGRGSDIPAAVALLSSPEAAAREKALSQLHHCLEHQDTLMQATPFGVQALFEALASGSVVDEPGVIAILMVIARATSYQFDQNHTMASSLTLSDLIAPDRLWPPFVSEREEEVLWERWNPPDEEYLAYYILTAQVLVTNRPVIEAIQYKKPTTRVAVERLLHLVAKLENQLQHRPPG